LNKHKLSLTPCVLAYINPLYKAVKRGRGQLTKERATYQLVAREKRERVKRELIESIDSSLGFLKPKSLNSAHSKLLYILFVIYMITGMYFSEFEM
jgi:hypothetical protein